MVKKAATKKATPVAKKTPAKKITKAKKTAATPKAVVTATPTAKPTPKATKATKAATPKATAKAAAKPKAPSKATKAPVKPKKASETAAGPTSLDVCLLLDTTASMMSWIERSKNTLKGIIQEVKQDNVGITVRVCFVGYRDIKDSPRFEVLPFTEDLDAATAFIAKQRAMGGADFPEDVQGGFNKALNMDWKADSAKQVFLICDAPGHGKDICDSGDNYPNGSPDGYKIQD